MRFQKFFTIFVLVVFVIVPFRETKAIQTTPPEMLLPPSTTFGWTFEGNQNQTYFGSSWRPAGDVNGDGFDDLIVGAHGFDTTRVDAGRAMVFYGSLDGYNASVPDWSLDGEFPGDHYGVSVSGAGDVNGDGYDDVLVGAYGFDLSAPVTADVGKVYLYYGSSSGLSTTPAWTVSGTQASQILGYRVASAGNLNGDGYADIAIGSFGYDGGEVDEGRVYVYYGSDTVPASTADWTAESNQASSRFSISLNGIGDVNGDGFDDLIVGASYYTNGTTNEGAAFVWFGSPTGLGDPGTPINADWMAESNQTTRFFAEFLGTPGDVNGDGFDDVVISSREYDKGQSDEGAVFFWYGSASGPNLGVNGSPANADWWAEGNAAGYGFGTVTGTQADINNDGYDDVIVGCIFGTPGIYVYYGSASGPNLGVMGDRTNSDWHVNEPAIPGLYNALFAWQAGSSGDANGDGIDDVAVVSLNYNEEVLNTNPSYREGKMWAYYSKMGAITGTITYTGNLSPDPVIEITAHLDKDGPPDAFDHKISGESYSLRGLNDGHYYIYAYIDLNGSGGPPDPGEPIVFYDPDEDGEPDTIQISGLGRVGDINLKISAWFLHLPLNLR